MNWSEYRFGLVGLNADDGLQPMRATSRHCHHIVGGIRRFDADHPPVFLIAKISHSLRLFNPRIPDPHRPAALFGNTNTALPA